MSLPICQKSGGQLWRSNRTFSCSAPRSCRPWNVADCCSAHIRHFCKRSSGFQLRRPFWRCQCQLAGGNADNCPKYPKHEPRFRPAQRFFTHGFLPALCTLHRHRSYYKKRKQLMEVHTGDDYFPASLCLDNLRNYFPNRKLVSFFYLS